MSDWFTLSRENLIAAKVLLDRSLYRSAVSRAYYSAYAALAGQFERQKWIKFSHGGNNPSHEQLLSLSANNLDAKRFGRQTRREISRAVALLQAARIVADYVPGQTTDRAVARDMVHRAAFVSRAIVEAA